MVEYTLPLLNPKPNTRQIEGGNTQCALARRKLLKLAPVPMLVEPKAAYAGRSIPWGYCISPVKPENDGSDVQIKAQVAL